VRSESHCGEQEDNREFEESFELEYGEELEHSPREDDPTIHSPNLLLVDNPHYLLHRPSIGAFSTHSAANEERIEALQKANASLAKKLRESTRELEHKLGEHEAEVEELQVRIEDLKAELATARREEKELKVKEASS
jgi:predicted RNase H-like nuclease (RuvC/YqgF family)